MKTKITEKSQDLINVSIWIDSNSKSYSKSRKNKCHDVIRCQIDNLLHWKWNAERIYLLTNFDFKYNGVKSIKVGKDYAPTWSPTVNKFPVLNYFIKNGLIKQKHILLHDVDSFQINKLSLNIDEGMFFVPKRGKRRRRKISGGISIVHKDKYDIIEKMVEGVNIFSPKYEEKFYHLYFKSINNIKEIRKTKENLENKLKSNSKSDKVIKKIDHIDNYWGKLDLYDSLDFSYNLTPSMAGYRCVNNFPIKFIHFNPFNKKHLSFYIKNHFIPYYLIAIMKEHNLTSDREINKIIGESK